MTDLVDTKRIIPTETDPICKKLRLKAPPGTGRAARRIETSGEAILVTDPAYLIVLEMLDDPLTQYVRSHALIAGGFGGDTMVPVLWKDPYVVLPTSAHYVKGSKEGQQPAGTEIIGWVGCDSGMFMFLPLRDDLPEVLVSAIQHLLGQPFLGARLFLPGGKWTIHYEQWQSKDGEATPAHRNVILKHEAE